MTGSDSEFEILGLAISAWIYAPFLFIFWLVFFYSLKGILFRKLRKWGERAPRPWKTSLISNLHLPLNVIILSSGLAFVGRLLPLPADIDQAVVVVVKTLAIIALFFFADRLILQSLSYLSSKVRTIDLSGGVVQGLVRLTVFSFALLIILDSLGISITPFIASLGIGSIAVALGLQETLANLFAGLFILADQPVRVGDFIRLETGEEGYVVDIGWRNTRIRMLSNVMVVVPNNKITSSTIRNYYLPDKELAALVEVRIHYASDLEKAERVAVEVAHEVQKRVQGAVPEFEPFIRYHTFSDFGVNFSVILRVREFTDQYLLKHEFIKALHQRYQEEGILIPYPNTLVEPRAWRERES